MMRLTRTIAAGLIGVAGWTPAWLPALLVSPVMLAAQQHASPRHADHDASQATDDDTDNDADNSDDDQSGGFSAGGRHDHHTVDIARMFHAARDATFPLKVDISYGAGSLSVAPADKPWLYDVRADYTTATDAPVVSFDSISHVLHVGGRRGTDGSVSISLGDHSSKHDDDLTVALARAVPLDLQLRFGGGDVTAQLGGLSVQNLDVYTGASDAQLSFNSPNPITLDHLSIHAGAVGFRGTGLGNAHARHVVLHAGAGDIDLDFGGEWTGDATLDITAAAGSVEIHVPQGVVVDLAKKETFIGSTDDHTGPTTPQVPGGPLYHLRVTSQTMLGSLDFDRKTRE